MLSHKKSVLPHHCLSTSSFKCKLWNLRKCRFTNFTSVIYFLVCICIWILKLNYLKIKMYIIYIFISRNMIFLQCVSKRILKLKWLKILSHKFHNMTSYLCIFVNVFFFFLLIVLCKVKSTNFSGKWFCFHMFIPSFLFL